MCKHYSNKGKVSPELDPEAHVQDHKKWSRRSFLSTLGLGVFGSSLGFGNLSLNAMPSSPFLEQIAASNTDRVLVIIQLSGGNDGLNTIIPFRNDVYFQKRATIAIRQNEAIALSDEIGMHPSMEALRTLWDQGKMNVVNNVGYQNPSRSHSRGTDIWTSASDSDENLSTGWIGRYLESEFPTYNLEPPTYPLGVRIGGSSSVFESDFGNLGVTFGGASQFSRFLEQGGFYNVNSVPENAFGRALQKSRQVANDSFKYLEAIESAASNTQNLTEYPNSSLAESLSVVARMIRGGLGSRVYLVSRGGFDTHNSQGGVEGPHANLLNDVSSSIAAFYEDLSTDGFDQSTLSMTFSEFGRTLDENDNRGTDHGSSAPVLVFGPVLGGISGEHATLTELDNSGDPIYKQDYRAIYKSVLEDWFELDPSQVNEVLKTDIQKLDLIDQRLTSTNEVESLPLRIKVFQNYPNPFNPSTTIRFELPNADYVRLEVFTIQGKKVSELMNRYLQAGSHQIVFDAKNLPSGNYLYQFSLGNGQRVSKKMTLIK